MSRLVVASNRVAIPQKGAVPGGLAVGLQSALQSAGGGLWFGWSGLVRDAVDATCDATARGGIEYLTTDLAQAEYDDYYLGFANGVLWPVFHYFIGGMRFMDAQYAAFRAVNERFAACLAPRLHPSDRVWVHDFHLIPLGKALREAGCRQRLGFFLHIPFPAPEVLRVIPVQDDLLADLLAYDVVGFQTATDLAAFRAAVAARFGAAALTGAETLRVGNRIVRAEVFPIGIDVDATAAEATRARRSEACRRMIAGLLGRQLVIGVDRLDYSKGLVERFRAYEHFLEASPACHNRVTFLQIAPLSRIDVQAYATIRRQLEGAAGRTNGRFADTDWTPIRYLNRNFPHDVLMSFLRAARVGLVTPVRDGMNLVAKEFVAAQDPDDPGVLVLSELAGAARELDAALLVNPYDARGIALALQRALAMPLTERRERNDALLAVLRRNDIRAWIDRFVQRLHAPGLARPVNAAGQ
jgi:trehalose 6-phosphate synthase